MNSELSEQQREQVAIHESGHFVVAEELGLEMTEITTVSDKIGGYRGRVHVNIRDAEGNYISIEQADQDTQLNCIACFLAGEVAQHIHSPEFKNDVRNEMLHPKEWAKARILAARINVDNLEKLTQEQKERAQEILEARWEDVKKLAVALEPPCTLTADEARQVIGRQGV